MDPREWEQRVHHKLLPKYIRETTLCAVLPLTLAFMSQVAVVKVSDRRSLIFKIYVQSLVSPDSL